MDKKLMKDFHIITQQGNASYNYNDATIFSP